MDTVRRIQFSQQYSHEKDQAVISKDKNSTGLDNLIKGKSKVAETDAHSTGTKCERIKINLASLSLDLFVNSRAFNSQSLVCKVATLDHDQTK